MVCPPARNNNALHPGLPHSLELASATAFGGKTQIQIVGWVVSRDCGCCYVSLDLLMTEMIMLRFKTFDHQGMRINCLLCEAFPTSSYSHGMCLLIFYVVAMKQKSELSCIGGRYAGSGTLDVHSEKTSLMITCDMIKLKFCQKKAVKNCQNAVKNSQNAMKNFSKANDRSRSISAGAFSTLDVSLKVANILSLTLD
ncbi:hypothetical protein Tco_0909623 [Tanacetum coccineum]|uniref:Uncharacterized protein n=1 Tax=Tanacetum coccineum TaxID=301880 RepID=A0ABQ5CQZ6_9ASTR